MLSQKEEIKKLLEKVNEAKKGNVDLSQGEDLSIAIMNLVGLEEHFFFTAGKTKKTKYFDLMKKVREMRTQLMAKLVKNPEGEGWCISKHLLAASMRLIEVGTKAQGKGQTKEAEEYFAKAYELYNLFWGINLKIIDLGKIKKIKDGQLNSQDKEGTNFMGKLNTLIKKIVDCCIE